MKDECGICGRVLYLSSLRRCSRCKKLHCRSCMTWNLWSEQRDLICLNCARRIVAPKRAGTKYSLLKDYLWRRGRFTSHITLTFSKIEGIINTDLPFGALRNERWWNNNESSPQGNSWTSAGWKVQSVDLKERIVTLKKEIAVMNQPKRESRRGTSKKFQKPFTPVPVKPYRTRKPSKTRIAKVVARAKNIERRRASAPIRIKLKPKSPYEKRLYKPEQKPKS